MIENQSVKEIQKSINSREISIKEVVEYYLDKIEKFNPDLNSIVLQKDRELIIKELLAYGIETRPFFYPMHKMEPYKDYKTSTSLKNSKNISSCGLSLPSSVKLSPNEQNFVIRCLIKVIEKELS